MPRAIVNGVLRAGCDVACSRARCICTLYVSQPERMVLHRGANRIIQAHDDTTQVVIRSSSHARCVVAGWQLGRLGQDDVLVHSTDAVTRRLDLLVIILDSRIRHWNLSALQRGHQYNYE